MTAQDATVPSPTQMTPIALLTTGGTIDKVYFDAKSTYSVGESEIPQLLRNAHVDLQVEVTQLLRKDSLELTDEDRELIRRSISALIPPRVVVTHGTDTMITTAQTLRGIPDKTIVLTGALIPARFRDTDALYNAAAAFTAVQCLPPGVYITMNGRVFDPDHVQKNLTYNRFENI